MNEDTLVAVSCYAGDAQQVAGNLPAYIHHQTPILILSPADSPVIFSGADCRQAGKRAYIGQDSLDRKRKYLEILLTFPHKYFLFNDSDSMCLSPNIPRFVYDEPDIFWSNEVVEPRPHASPYPKIAMQPPYFFSRDTIQKLLAVADRITAHPITPYIDWYMVALVCEAGILHKSFMNTEDPYPCKEIDQSVIQGATWSETEIYCRVRYHGKVFVHPIKDADYLQRLLAHHAAYRCTTPTL